ncbi:MAG: mechanosensitive ion channel family protein [Coxiella endosymbiont of Dermacentor nuttalli]
MQNLIIKITLLISLGGGASFLEWMIFQSLIPHLKQRKRFFQCFFLQALHQPLQIYIFVITLTFIISTITQLFVFDNDFSDFVNISFSVRFIFTLIIIFWFAIRFLRHLEDNLITRVRQSVCKVGDETSVHALAQLIRIVIIVFILLILLQTIGIKISALLTFSGIGVAVVGFSAKDILRNVFGGIMIYWDRPFSVGDWISSPDRQIDGTVEYIGWRLTRLRTFDKRPLYIPNGILSNIAIENPSRMTNRHLKIKVGVSYSNVMKIPDLVKAIENMLRKNPAIDTAQTLFVNLFEIDHSSLNMLVCAFTKTTKWMKYQATQQNVILEIINIISQFGANCTFSTQMVDYPKGIF